jgi:tetratricopeptide (TPR) repeat protein
MGTQSRTVIGCALLCSFIMTSTVHAAPSAAAQARSKQTYQVGVTLFKAQKYRAAIREFNKAYRDSPSPTLLYNIARAFEELGEYQLAIDSYNEYLKLAPQAADKDRVARTLTTLGRLEQSGSSDAEIQILSIPVGAEVTVDGETVGKTPLTLTLSSGSHRVAFAYEDYESVALSYKVEPRRAGTLSQSLRSVEVVERVRAVDGWLSWALVGAGATAMVGGAVSFVIGERAADEASDLRATRAGLGRYNSLREDHALAFGVGVTSLGIGALLVGGGLTLLLNGSSDTSQVAVSSNGLYWGGQF